MTLIPLTPAEARQSHLESAFWRKRLIWGLSHVPYRIQQASMPLWSLFFYLQVPPIRRAIDQNLSSLLHLPTMRRQQAAFRTFTNYCRCVANAYSWHSGIELPLSVEIDDLPLLREVVSRGQGAILASGHLGNWQLGPYLLTRHGFPPITVVMNEEPNQGAQAIEAAARDRRLRIIYHGRSPLLSLELRAAFARGEFVGMQIDRPPTGTGIALPCAGRLATFSTGPALLARICQVPVVPIYFPLTARGLRIQIFPPQWSPRTKDREQDIHDLTRRLAEIYTQQITRYPEQWFNFYDFWNGNKP